jgi:hypothetical protein
MITGQTPSSIGISKNKWASAVINSVTGGDTLNLLAINNPTNTTVTQLEVSGDQYWWVILRPGASRLAAIPFSGPAGREQSFFFADPTSTIHTVASPTATQINNARVQGIVPPEFGPDPDVGDLTPLDVNRADAVFPGVGKAGSKLGYRVILYPDNGSGAADLTKPITSFTPAIDSTIASGNDQRYTIDYKAGVVRLSVAPRAGDAFKPSTGNQGVGSGGRLNLYAVFWAFDTTLVKGAAQQLWSIQTSDTDNQVSFESGRVFYNTGTLSWTITMAPIDSQPASLPGNDVRTHLRDLLEIINNPPVPLLEDPHFESVLTYPETQDIDASAAWRAVSGTPDNSLLIDRTSGFGTSRLSYVAPNTSFNTVGIIQHLWATVSGNQEFRINLTYQRISAATSGSLQVNLTWLHFDGSTNTDNITITPLNGTDASRVDYSNVTFSPTDAVKLISVRVSASSQYGSTGTKFYVDKIQVTAVAGSFRPTYQVDRSTSFRQRFLPTSGSNVGYTNQNPVLSAGSTVKPSLLLQRADGKEDPDGTLPQPTFNTGAIELGSGMKNPIETQSRILIKVETGTFAGIKRIPTVGIYDAEVFSGTQMYASQDFPLSGSYWEVGQNLSWNQVTQVWDKVSGGDRGNLLRLKKDELQVLTANGSNTLGIEGPLRTGTAASVPINSNIITVDAGSLLQTGVPQVGVGDRLILRDVGGTDVQYVRIVQSVDSETQLTVESLSGIGPDELDPSNAISGATWTLHPHYSREMVPGKVTAGESFRTYSTTGNGTEIYFEPDVRTAFVEHTGTVQVYMPEPKSGRKVTVKDISGNADIYPITLWTGFGVPVDGLPIASFDISSPYGSVTMLADGTSWWFV